MSNMRLEIQWAPYCNKFISWGTEIYLYEVDNLKDLSGSCIKLSDFTGANLLATTSKYNYIKCIDICPQVDSDLLLAIGQASGKIVLTTFGPNQYDNQSLHGKEFLPRHPRQCNALTWNPIDSNLLVAGLDKYRSDNCILLWDVFKCPFATENGSRQSLTNSFNSHHHNLVTATEIPKPISELGISETAHSLAWFTSQSRTIVSGMNLKQLKLIDFRDQNKVVSSTATKAVYGVAVDPHNDYQIVSHIDNQIFIWDTRNFEKPVVSLVQNKQVLKILWCPTRNNLLGSIQRDSSLINLHDIQQTTVNKDELEPSVLERCVSPGSPHNITSFSWHPKDENRLITIALSGSIVDYTVFERITLNWAPNFNMVWTHGRRTMKLVNCQSNMYEAINDISLKIKHRATEGYGLKHDLWKNGELADDPDLKNLWDWLYLSRSLVEEGKLKGSAFKHPGVCSILKFENSPVNGNNYTKCESILWSELGILNCFSSVKVYRNEERDRALYLCEWRFDKDGNALKLFLEKLEIENSYSRAAAIAVFNLKMHLAIEILNRGAEKNKTSNLNIVAMALAGFSDDKNSMWRQFCQSTRNQLKDSYLRALFAFLTCDNECYEGVLNEGGVCVKDRVAFACIFLSDNKLNEYLKSLTIKLTEEGNLAGILLTGTTLEGIYILQKYLDHTGDVQSPCVLAVRAFPPDLLRETMVQEWVSSYRHVLDSWRLWNQRALFDIALSSCSPNDKPPQQVYVSCTYCGKSISAYMQSLNRGRGFASRIGTSNKLKLSSCPNCRKPLPRCAICLMHMGTASGCPSYAELGRSEAENNKMVEYSSWFTWCQSCRHGGHAAHITCWFKEHSECPVTGCTCRCFSIDMC